MCRKLQGLKLLLLRNNLNVGGKSFLVDQTSVLSASGWGGRMEGFHVLFLTRVIGSFAIKRKFSDASLNSEQACDSGWRFTCNEGQKPYFSHSLHGNY